MELGARTSAWSGGEKMPTAMDYVQDGLVAMWDGIENAGWGIHDPNATSWVDLSENGWDFTLNPNRARVAFGDSYLDMKNIELSGIWAAYTPKGYIGNGYSCLEIVYAPYNRIMEVFNPGGSSSQENSDYGYYASDKYIQFGTSFGVDKWRYAYTSSIGKQYYAACNINIHPKIKHYGYVNGFPVERTDSGAISGYDRAKYSSLGGRYPVQDWGASGRIYALRLHSRMLTDTEIAANYAIDKARFGLT